MRIPTPAVVLAVATALSIPTCLTAQPGGRIGDAPALSVGPRLLVDFDASVLTLGGEVRFAPPAPEFLQIRAAYDFTFLDGLTERTLMLDLLLATRGFAVGGGPAVRNTRISSEDPREDIRGWSAVVMLGGDPRVNSRFSFGLELRFLFLDDFEPRTFGAVLGVPLF